MNKTTLTIIAAAVVVALAAFGIVNSKSSPEGQDMSQVAPAAGEATAGAAPAAESAVTNASEEVKAAAEAAADAAAPAATEEEKKAEEAAPASEAPAAAEPAPAAEEKAAH
jgi:hypothetical protein